MSNKIQYLLLYLILVFAFSLRIYGISWDSGNHLHPDERAIILSVLGLRFPTSIESFLSPESSWNTHFFAYGSFPFYLLKILGDIASIFDPSLSGYDGIQLVGRFISSIFDVGTVLVLFFLGKKLKGERVGLLAAFFYAISVLPIQLSHFYAVDTPLTFFITLTLLLLIRFYEKPTLLRSLLVGIFFGFALATKISAIVITATIGITLTIDFLLIFLKRPHRLDVWGPHLPPFTKRLLKDAIIFIVATIFTYLILSPYTFIDFLSFQRQTAEQSAMTKNAFTFPYTLQYVGKTPYFYELKNIFLYGIGPLLAAVCFVGLIIFLLEMVKKYRSIDFAKHTILIVFFIAYFGVVGGFAIGFMRYMLPLYPLLCLFGAVLIYKLLTIFPPKKNVFYFILHTSYFILLLTWPLSFMHIYGQKHSRVQATEWIHKTIPQGATIAVEHWDDALPLSGIEKYTVLTYPLYEPDTPEKWNLMKEYLAQTDYIILSSNRLYTPLQKLTNCDVLPSGRCYPQTAMYYRALFQGLLGFKKVAEFTSFPTIPLLNIPIDDQGADESFTVYDHPKVMIFQKQ